MKKKKRKKESNIIIKSIVKRGLLQNKFQRTLIISIITIEKYIIFLLIKYFFTGFIYNKFPWHKKNDCLFLSFKFSNPKIYSF